MRRSKWETFYVLLLLMMLLTGLFLALYPTVQGAIVDHRMVWEAEDFLSRMEPEDSGLPIIVFPTEPEKTKPRQHNALWEAMTAYNETIFAEGQAELSNNASYQTPSFCLKDYGLEDEKFGVISIPKLELEMPLYLGANYDNMAAGAAVLSQTSIPIGGANTNAVIAGHRGWGGASYFRYVTDLSVGDEVIITNLWETLTYKVVETKIIDPHEFAEILIQPNKDMITLLTCHPYASGGKQRYLIYCERETDLETHQDGSGQNSGKDGI